MLLTRIGADTATYLLLHLQPIEVNRLFQVARDWSPFIQNLSYWTLWFREMQVCRRGGGNAEALLTRLRSERDKRNEWRWALAFVSNFSCNVCHRNEISDPASKMCLQCACAQAAKCIGCSQDDPSLASNIQATLDSALFNQSAAVQVLRLPARARHAVDWEVDHLRGAAGNYTVYQATKKDIIEVCVRYYGSIEVYRRALWDIKFRRQFERNAHGRAEARAAARAVLDKEDEYIRREWLTKLDSRCFLSETGARKIATKRRRTATKVKIPRGKRARASFLEKCLCLLAHWWLTGPEFVEGKEYSVGIPSFQRAFNACVRSTRRFLEIRNGKELMLEIGKSQGRSVTK